MCKGFTCIFLESFQQPYKVSNIIHIVQSRRLKVWLVQEQLAHYSKDEHQTKLLSCDSVFSQCVVLAYSLYYLLIQQNPTKTMKLT